MKLFPILLMAALICGCDKHLTSDQKRQIAETDKFLTEEKTADKIHMERDAMAREKILQTATNDVVGIKTIIQIFANTDSSDTNQWNGFVKLEYVNRLGGVERTNLFYKFRTAREGMLTMVFCDPYVPLTK